MATLQQKKYTESDKVKEAYQNYLNYKNEKLPDDYAFSQDELHATALGSVLQGLLAAGCCNCEGIGSHPYHRNAHVHVVCQEYILEVQHIT